MIKNFRHSLFCLMRPLFSFLSAVGCLLCLVRILIVLSLLLKELCEVKRKCSALQMQQFVGEEKNELLDYLRSLQPEKVFSSTQLLSMNIILLFWSTFVTLVFFFSHYTFMWSHLALFYILCEPREMMY